MFGCTVFIHRGSMTAFSHIFTRNKKNRMEFADDDSVNSHIEIENVSIQKPNWKWIETWITTLGSRIKIKQTAERPNAVKYRYIINNIDLKHGKKFAIKTKEIYACDVACIVHANYILLTTLWMP